MSVWQRPDASILTTISPEPATGLATSRTCAASSKLSTTTARIVSVTAVDGAAASMSAVLIVSPSLELEAHAPRELTVRRHCLGQRSRLLQPLAHLEQICRQIDPADVDAEAVDQAARLDDGAPRLPERAALSRTRLGFSPSDEAEHAVRCFDPGHVFESSAFGSAGHRAVRGFACGLIRNEKGGLSAALSSRAESPLSLLQPRLLRVLEPPSAASAARRRASGHRTRCR